MLGVNWRRTSFGEKKIFHEDKLEMSLVITFPISTISTHKFMTHNIYKKEIEKKCIIGFIESKSNTGFLNLQFIKI